jgi:hypothetical protein
VNRHHTTDSTYAHHDQGNYSGHDGHRYRDFGINAGAIATHDSLSTIKSLESPDAPTQGYSGDRRQGKPFPAASFPKPLVMQPAQSNSASLISGKEIAHQVSDDEHDTSETNPRCQIQIGVDDLGETNRNTIRGIHNHWQSYAPQDEHKQRLESGKKFETICHRFRECRHVNGCWLTATTS